MESEQTLLSAISQITALDAGAMDAARKRQAELAKPPGSLGLLEDISVQLAGITGSVKNTIQKTRIYVLAADNGVVDEGVSSAPQSVTLAQSINLTRGLTGASCLAKHFGDELVVVDMGIRLPYHCPEIVNRSLGKGTKNFYKEPAMTRAQAVAGIAAGMALAAQAKKDGVSILGVGEMGIGNTTTSSAVLAALTGASIEDVTGRSGGSIGHITIRTMNGLGLGRGQNHHALLDAQIVDGDAFFTGGRFQRSRLIHMRDANCGADTRRIQHVTARLGLGSKN